MRVAALGDTISLRFALRLVNGSEILSNFDDDAADIFTLGDGTLAPNLEKWLMGLGEGERHVFILEAEQAFGLSTADKIHPLPADQVSQDTSLQSGNLVELTLPDGQTLAGKILEIGAENIRVDFNHPLADLPIEFEVEIMQFHEALTPESGADV